MKSIKTSMALLMAGVLSFTGCSLNDENEHHFDNKIYINTSVQTSDILFEAGTPVVESRELTVATPMPVEHEVTGRFVFDSQYAEVYNQVYGASAEALPSEMIVLTDEEVVMPAGSVESTAATVTFSGIENLDRATIYVAPVRLVDVQGVDILDSKTVVYYVFRGAALINVVAGLAENRAWPDWKDASPVTDMGQFTLEALVNCTQFGRQISTIMGIEGQFLIRIGDAGVPDNQIQVATRAGNLTNADLQLETGRWYHVAVTFDRGAVKVYIDGFERLSGSVGTSTVNFGVIHSDESDGRPRCFWIGYSYNDERYLDGYISEARIWNKALTADEINATNHFYKVEPDSEGLVAYWKFNDGAGSVVKDHTSYGNDLTVEAAPEWKAVTLPE